MTPKKDEYMRGYGDGFKDGIAHNGETGMVPVTGKERPMLQPEAASTEARFETASLHQIADGDLLDQAVAFAEMWGTEENWQHVRDGYVAAILRDRQKTAEAAS